MPFFYRCSEAYFFWKLNHVVQDNIAGKGPLYITSYLILAFVVIRAMFFFPLANVSESPRFLRCPR